MLSPSRTLSLPLFFPSSPFPNLTLLFHRTLLAPPHPPRLHTLLIFFFGVPLTQTAESPSFFFFSFRPVARRFTSFSFTLFNFLGGRRRGRCGRRGLRGDDVGPQRRRPSSSSRQERFQF
ncbi:hypothetical protein R5R35_013065 [Gryllus longicercus]|uniref:Uncharacterized protein n=1 Tax=Gryllus longicercus TaxID=2509291 RepID=A0AAN9YVU2_9ORTH